MSNISITMSEGTDSKRIELRTPNGDLHREWRLPNGDLHCENGPALEWTDGTKVWCQHGKIHRDNNLPAIEYANGDRHWYLRGKPHRDDGPAIERADGEKEYWLHGEKYSEEDFDQITNSNSNNSPKIKM